MNTGYVVAGVAAAAAIAFGVYMIDVDVSGEVEMPEVSVEGGELPNADVEVGEIETGTKEVTVEVPTVELKPAEDGDAVADEDVAEANN